jgi:hypothetical protein
VLVNHRVARHTQRIDAVGADAPQKEARHGDGLAVVAYVNRRAGRDAPEQRHLAGRVNVHLLVLHRQPEGTVRAVARDEAATLKRLDVLGDGRLRGDAEVARYLRVGRLVPVALDEARDVFENLPLALCAGLHR